MHTPLGPPPDDSAAPTPDSVGPDQAGPRPVSAGPDADLFPAAAHPDDSLPDIAEGGGRAGAAHSDPDKGDADPRTSTAALSPDTAAASSRPTASAHVTRTATATTETEAVGPTADVVIADPPRRSMPPATADVPPATEAAASATTVATPERWEAGTGRTATPATTSPAASAAPAAATARIVPADTPRPAQDESAPRPRHAGAVREGPTTGPATAAPDATGEPRRRTFEADALPADVVTLGDGHAERAAPDRTRRPGHHDTDEALGDDRPDRGVFEIPADRATRRRDDTGSAEPPRAGRPRATGPRRPLPPSLPTAGDASVPRSRVDVSAWLGALLSLPWTLSSLGLLLVVGALLGDHVWAPLTWLVPVSWLLSASVIFLPGCESLLARISLNSRPPTEGERRVLEPIWDSVLDDVVADPRRFQLWVQDVPELNAAAAGGRIVIVTKGALRLPAHTLAAVLAHELGHHLGGHSLILRLHGWYSIPIRLFLALTVGIARLVGAIGNAITRTGSAVGMALALIALVAGLAFAIYLSPILLLVPVASVLLAAASRLSEIRADRMAARLGYGPALIEVLTQWMRDGHAANRTPPGLRARLFASHPSHSRRIRKLEEYLGR
ncbi:Zn-dependent protease with chaperone function [Actinoalloteichus hoggarensis]|uniref:Heat shock protein HtpX n=1 Tax=Actinoalloteichus hoggarensis TaxID=1470176 RepID=A0A221WA93_9PSEU|nr:M48 family metalloprotease [Actinoalloteichus hoggarensis]ASO22237.1 heat shock protein HtpX [Actinoalloteichus hoggarensis]MBB5923342.1 Zn-dependent protease with chaperone function [Actinoalloteichus hoggarensis]